MKLTRPNVFASVLEQPKAKLDDRYADCILFQRNVRSFRCRCFRIIHLVSVHDVLLDGANGRDIMRKAAAAEKAKNRKRRPSRSKSSAKVVDLFGPPNARAASSSELNSVEICAGAGGQALGLEHAGFSHAALVELESAACATLRANRPDWNVIECDLRSFSGSNYKRADLVAGGVPCPPFSKAGKQLGNGDERDLFPEAIRLVDEIRPKAVMLENVRGLLDPVFDKYRSSIETGLHKLGYTAQWKLLNASNFGVPQLRPRVVMVALRNEFADAFSWPQPSGERAATVGECLADLMAERGWELATRWREWANDIAPTLVGGSKKHGGPDLGPTRAKRAWAQLCVDGMGIADHAPDPDFVGFPRLTTRMAARLQGFPDEWQISGRKTAAYRQVGNAFPPPVAQAVAIQIKKALSVRRSVKATKAA